MEPDSIDETLARLREQQYFASRELATALFLYTSGTQLFSLAMFDYWQRGSTGLVAVMALAQTFILLVFVLLGSALRRDRMDTSLRPAAV